MIEILVDAIELRSPPSVAPDTPVSDAAKRLRRPRVHALPVLEDDTIVGVVTESDIVALVAETDEQPAVRAIVSTPPATILPTATIHDAAETMRTNGVKQLPVVDDDTYHGLLLADTLELYLSRHTLDIEWEGKPLRTDGAQSQSATAGD